MKNNLIKADLTLIYSNTNKIKKTFVNSYNVGMCLVKVIFLDYKCETMRLVLLSYISKLCLTRQCSTG